MRSASGSRARTSVFRFCRSRLTVSGWVASEPSVQKEIRPRSEAGFLLSSVSLEEQLSTELQDARIVGCVDEEEPAASKNVGRRVNHVGTRSAASG